MSNNIQLNDLNKEPNTNEMNFNEIRINPNEEPIQIKKDWLLNYRNGINSEEMQQRQIEGKYYTLPLVKAILLSHYNRTAWNDPESQVKYTNIKNGQMTDELRDISQKLMVDEENSGRIITERKFCMKKVGLLGKISPRWFVFKGTNLVVFHNPFEDNQPKFYSLIGAAYEVEDRDSPPHKVQWTSPIELISEDRTIVHTDAKYRLSVVTKEPKARHFCLYSNKKEEIADWVKIFHVANLNLDPNQAALISNVITRIAQRDIPTAWDALVYEAENRAHRETMLRCFVNRLRYLKATRVLNKWKTIHKVQNKDYNEGLKLLGREVMLGRLYRRDKLLVRTSQQREAIIELIQEGYRNEKSKSQAQMKISTESLGTTYSDAAVAATSEGAQIKQGQQGRDFATVFYVNPSIENYYSKILNAKEQTKKSSYCKHTVIPTYQEDANVRISNDLSRVIWTPKKWESIGKKSMFVDVDSISSLIVNASKPTYLSKGLYSIPNIVSEYDIAECVDEYVYDLGDSCFSGINENEKLQRDSQNRISTGNWLAICGPRLGFKPAHSPDFLIRDTPVVTMKVNINVKSISLNDRFSRLYTEYYQYYADELQEMTPYEKTTTMAALTYGDNSQTTKLNTIKSLVSNIQSNEEITREYGTMSSNISSVRRLFSAVTNIENDCETNSHELSARESIKPSNSTIASIRNLFTRNLSSTREFGSPKSASPMRSQSKIPTTVSGSKPTQKVEGLVLPPELSVVNPFETVQVDRNIEIRDSTVQTYLRITAFHQTYTSAHAVGVNPTYDLNFSVEVPLKTDNASKELIDEARKKAFEEAICTVDLWVKSPIENIPDELIASIDITLAELCKSDRITRKRSQFIAADSFILKQPIPDLKISTSGNSRAIQILKYLGLLDPNSDDLKELPVGQLEFSADSIIETNIMGEGPISPETICLGGLQGLSSFSLEQAPNQTVHQKNGDCVELYIGQVKLDVNWTPGLYFVEVIMGDVSCMTHLVQTRYDSISADFRSHLYIPRYDNKLGVDPKCLQILIRRALGTEDRCSSLARLLQDSVVMGELLVDVTKLTINEPHSSNGLYAVFRPSASSLYGSKGLDYALEIAQLGPKSDELQEAKQHIMTDVQIRMMITLRRKIDVTLKKVIDQSDDFKLIGDTALLVVEEELKYPVSQKEFHIKCCPGNFDTLKAGTLGLPLRSVGNYIEFEIGGFQENSDNQINDLSTLNKYESDSILNEELEAIDAQPVPLYASDPVPAQFYLPEDPRTFRSRKLPGIWHRILADGFRPGERVTRLTHRVRYVPVTIIAIYKNRTALCKWGENVSIVPTEFPEGCVFIPEQRLVMGVPLSFLSTPHKAGIHVYDSTITRLPDNSISLLADIENYGGYMPSSVNPIFCEYEWILWIKAETQQQMTLWATIIRNTVRERAFRRVRAYERTRDIMNGEEVQSNDCKASTALISRNSNSRSSLEKRYDSGELEIVVHSSRILCKNKEKLNFYSVFQWARIPVQLYEMIENEGNYDVKSGIRHAIKRMIEESILGFNMKNRGVVNDQLTPQELRPNPISMEIAKLHASYIPFSLSTQLKNGNSYSVDRLKDEFMFLATKITFSSYYLSNSCKGVLPDEISPFVKNSKEENLLEQISGELVGIIPDKLDSKKLTDEVYNTYRCRFYNTKDDCEKGGCKFTTTHIETSDEVPLLVVKLFQENNDEDIFVGHVILNTVDYLTPENPFQIKHKKIIPRYSYVVSASGTGGKMYTFDKIPEALKFVLSQNSEIKAEDFYRALYGETNQARRIHGPWRVRVQEEIEYHGEICLLIRYGPTDIRLLSEFQPTSNDYKEHILDYHRKQFDESGIPYIQTVYDPNTPFALKMARIFANNYKQLNGNLFELLRKYANDTKMLKLIQIYLLRPAEQWVYERCLYEETLFLVPLTDLLEKQNMTRWKYLLADYNDTGLKQWEQLYKQGLLLHKVDELSYDSWSILVNANVRDRLPLILLELWNGEEYLGEYLLPSLSSLLLSNVNTTVRLHTSALARENDKKTRYDIRKENLTSSKLSTFINMELSWRIKSTTEGIFGIVVKDVRNVVSELTDDLNEIKPQVHLYQYFSENDQWRLLEITKPSIATRTILGIETPEKLKKQNIKWDNVFVYSRDRVVDLQFPISIPAMVESVPIVFNFSELLSPDNKTGCDEDVEITERIWSLLKSGVPNYYRPYVWMQLSGANDLKNTINRKWQSLNDSNKYGHESLFSYLIEYADTCNSCVLRQLDEDIESAKIKYHMCESILGIDNVQTFWENVRYIMRAIIVFSLRKKYNVYNCEKFHVGLPIQYAYGLLALTIELLMNFGGVCLTTEDVFYLLFSVCGSKHNIYLCSDNNSESRKKDEKVSTKNKKLIKGALLQYFTSEEREDDFNNDMPAQINDIIFVKSALELLHPYEYDNMLASGFQLEEVLYGCLTSLFAGSLPSSTITQLYDLLFNVYFQPKDIFIKKKCSNFVKNDKVNISISRRILICLSYYIITESYREININPLISSRCIRETIKSTMATMRDPLEMIHGIERADFIIFGNKKIYENILKLYETYIISYQESLWFSKKQNSVLEKMINMTPLQSQHGSDAPSHIGMRFIGGRYVPKTVVSPGLSLKDLTESLYPLIKFQALYAGRSLHQLPPGVAGYVIIKIDEVREFAKYSEPISPVVCVKMDQYKVATDPATERCSRSFIWKSNNVFMFPIPIWKSQVQKKSSYNRGNNYHLENQSEPEMPLTVDVFIEVLDSEAIDEDNKLLCSAQLSLDRWSTNGGSLCLNGDDGTLAIFNECSKMSLLFSWYTYIPNNELDTSALLPFSFGKQQWGDYSGYHSIYAPVNVESYRNELHSELKEEKLKEWESEPKQSVLSIIRNLRKMDEAGGNLETLPTLKSMYPGKLEISTGKYGPTRSQLQQLFFFSAPSLLPYVDEIVESFAKISSNLSEEKISLTPVPLRELIASIILSSRGTLSEKANLLFDLFGYDDPNRSSVAFHSMYYSHTPQCPAAIQVGSQLNTHLPLEVSDKLGVAPSNVISLAGVAAIVQTACIRSNIPLDNVGIYQITASVFDHYFDVPSVLKALIIPPKDYDGRVSKEYITHNYRNLKYDTSSISNTEDVIMNNMNLFNECKGKNGIYNTINCMGPQNSKENAYWYNIDHMIDSKYVLDVSRSITHHIRKNASLEGLFGIDFSVHTCLRHFDINDPFPGLMKTLRIIISGKRSKHEIRIIDLTVDEKGHFIDARVQYGTETSADLHTTDVRGANQFRQAFESGLATVDFPRLLYSDGAANGKERVPTASFVFNLHNILIDKYSFVTRFCDFTLITEGIRRITANDRTCEPNQYLKLNVEVNVTLEESKSYPHYSVDEILGVPLKIINNDDLVNQFSQSLVISGTNIGNQSHRSVTSVNGSNVLLNEDGYLTQRSIVSTTSKQIFEPSISVHSSLPFVEDSNVSNQDNEIETKKSEMKKLDSNKFEDINDVSEKISVRTESNGGAVLKQSSTATSKIAALFMTRQSSLFKTISSTFNNEDERESDKNEDNGKYFSNVTKKIDDELEKKSVSKSQSTIKDIDNDTNEEDETMKVDEEEEVLLQQQLSPAILSLNSRRINSQTSLLSAVSRGASTVNLCRSFTRGNFGCYYEAEGKTEYQVDIPFRPPGQVEERHNIRVYMADSIRVLKNKIVEASKCIAQKLQESSIDNGLYKEIVLGPHHVVELVVTDFDGHVRYIPLLNETSSIEDYILSNEDLLQEFITSNMNSILNIRVTAKGVQTGKSMKIVNEMQHESAGACVTSMYLANELANHEILEDGLLIRNPLGFRTYFHRTHYEVRNKMIEIEPGKVVSLDNLCYVRRNNTVLNNLAACIKLDWNVDEWVPAVAIRGINTFLDELEGIHSETNRVRGSRIPQAVLNASTTIGGFMPVTLGAYNPISAAFDYGFGGRNSGISISSNHRNTSNNTNQSTKRYKTGANTTSAGTRKLGTNASNVNNSSLQNSSSVSSKIKPEDMITSVYGWDLCYEVILLDFHDLMIEGGSNTRDSICVSENDVVFCFRDPSVRQQFEITQLTTDEKIRIMSLSEAGMCPQRIALELSEDRVAALKSGSYSMLYDNQPKAVVVPYQLVSEFLRRFRAAIEEDKHIF
ncbi:hypothetical protein FG379_001727 [Cryptosporidium bovis]|uniref:uncharacterized protein n=1 Tax=Cryptosporidium bovis TaxID=310047 RepID=UPI003519E940|nr:hypothetical protein FG379_001727 [Cryptosporidium bovis]